VWLVFPLLFNSGLSQTLMSQMGIAIIACLSFNILLGQGGMLSFGHAVYSGVGAFAAIHTLNRITEGWPLPVSLVPLVGGLASVLLASGLGWITTKKSALPFAMISFGLAELVWAAALMFPGFFGGDAGVSGNRVVGTALWGISFGPQLQVTYLVGAYTLVCTALMYAFTGTPLGRMLNAVRDNPQRAAFVGYNPHRVRYLAFLMAAFFAGIAGGLAALNFELVSTDVFSAYRSGAYLIFTFLGGTAFFYGPILGGVLMVLAFVLLSEFTQAWLLYLGLTFLIMVIYAPGGLAGLFDAYWRLVRLGLCRRLARPLMGLVVVGSAALLVMVAGVEMLYHHAALDTQVAPLHFWGLLLDTQNYQHWCGVAAVAGLSGCLFYAQARRFGRCWRDVQQQLMQPNLRESD
jgi:branched-chain amino acid transport system permease protein